jgi:hypothetical protein
MKLFKRILQDETPEEPKEDPRVTRQRLAAETLARRTADPMLDYWNRDVRWVVLQSNIGPGGEYFTGVEVVAVRSGSKTSAKISDLSRLSTAAEGFDPDVYRFVTFTVDYDQDRRPRTNIRVGSWRSG